MAAEAGGNGGDTRRQDGTADNAWSIDWDAVPMARLVDDPSAEPAPRKRKLSADEAPPAEAAAAPPPAAPVPQPPPAPVPEPPAIAKPPPPPPLPLPLPRERLRPPVHRTVVPALDDLVRPKAEPAQDVAAPPPSPDASEPPPEPKRRRRRRRGEPTLSDAPSLPEATEDRLPRRGPVTPIRVIALLALTIACAVGGYLISQMDDGPPSSARDSPNPVQGQSSVSPPAVTPPAERPVDKRTLYPADEAFVSSGVRFTVVPEPIAAWARRIEASDPPDGLRWELVTVLYRNLSRERLLAEDLRFRLKDGANNVFELVPGAGNGGSDLGPQTPIPIGALVKGHLAFQVPARTRNLSLIIDPSPQARARVRLESG